MAREPVDREAFWGVLEASANGWVASELDNLVAYYLRLPTTGLSDARAVMDARRDDYLKAEEPLARELTLSLSCSDQCKAARRDARRAAKTEAVGGDGGAPAKRKAAR